MRALLICSVAWWNALQNSRRYRAFCSNCVYKDKFMPSIPLIVTLRLSKLSRVIRFHGRLRSGILSPSLPRSDVSIPLKMFYFWVLPKMSRCSKISPSIKIFRSAKKIKKKTNIFHKCCTKTHIGVIPMIALSKVSILCRRKPYRWQLSPNGDLK